MEDAVNAETVATRYGLSQQSVYNLCSQKDNPMPHRRFGRAYRFILSEVDAWAKGEKWLGKPTVRRAMVAK